LVVEKLNAGTGLDSLVAAAALANARTFGGQDYTGYHAFMALVPSYQMAQELPKEKRALPVLKVLYRNTNRIQQYSDPTHALLHPVAAGKLPKDRPVGEVLREATRSADFKQAESTFAALAKEPVAKLFNQLQYSIQDEIDVHRVVLAWRSWAMLDLAGKEQAYTLLRQSVRFCVDAEKNYCKKHPSAVRTVLPKLFDQYKLLGRKIGNRKAEDRVLERLAGTIYAGNRAQAAEAVAAILAEGMAPEAVGEAISL